MLYGGFRNNMKYFKWVRIDKIKVVKVGKNTQAKYILVYLGRAPWTKAKIEYTTRYMPVYPARVLAKGPLTSSTWRRYTSMYPAYIICATTFRTSDQDTRPRYMPMYPGCVLFQVQNSIFILMNCFSKLNYFIIFL